MTASEKVHPSSCYSLDISILTRICFLLLYFSKPPYVQVSLREINVKWNLQNLQHLAILMMTRTFTKTYKNIQKQATYHVMALPKIAIP